MGKIGVSLCIRGLISSADEPQLIRRLTAYLGPGRVSDQLPRDAISGTTVLIEMPSMEAAEDLRDELIDLGAIAEVIDHDAAS